MSEAYKALFATTTDCIKLLSREGRILDMNIGGLRLMGAERAEQLVGLDWVAFWEGRERQAAQAALDQALGGRAARSEGSAATLGGTVKRWDSILTPMPEPDGEVCRVLVISRDVTAFHDMTRLLGLEQRRSAALIRAVSQIVWRAEGGRKVHGHEDWMRYSGLETSADTPFHWLSAVHPDERDRVRARVEQGVAEQDAYEVSYRMRHHTGTWRWVQDRAVPLRDGSGALVEWVGLITDIHDRMESEAALRASEERMRLAVQANEIGIWDRDLVKDRLRWSPELKRMLGVAAHVEPSDPLLYSCIHPDDRRIVRDFLETYRTTTAGTVTVKFRVACTDATTCEERWLMASGRTVSDAAGRPVRRIGTCQDVTAPVLAERKLWQAANHDALTGLANRNLFSGALEAATQAAIHEGAAFAVLLLDLDEFKSINDTLGHGIGDLVLKATGCRLQQACPADAVVARLGGDEFAILIRRPGTRDDVVAHAERLAKALTPPITHADGVVHCAASMGVVICPSESCAPLDALRNADLALFEAKKAGNGRPALFTAGMASLLLQRATSLRKIEEALARDAIVPFYQPKIELATGRIDGFEALLRWHDGEGWRTPGAIAEAFSHPLLATRLGEKILDGVLTDLGHWRATGLEVGRIAINVSSVEFSTTDVAERLLGRLATAGLTPADLDLEVTESVVLGAQAATVGPALRRLHAHGLAIALDDFGTGFASLTHLRQHPFDWLKIERSFVNDIEADNDAAAIVSAVIGLAHGMGRRVVAEGVETAAQLEALRLSGCDVVQGFLLAKPMPASRVSHFVRTWTGLDREWAGALPIAS